MMIIHCYDRESNMIYGVGLCMHPLHHVAETEHKRITKAFLLSIKTTTVRRCEIARLRSINVKRGQRKSPLTFVERQLHPDIVYMASIYIEACLYRVSFNSWLFSLCLKISCRYIIKNVYYCSRICSRYYCLIYHSTSYNFFR